MAHTNNWDETIPTNTTNAIDIDDHIRKVRLDIRERMAVDHDLSSSDSGEADKGIHKWVKIKEATSPPTLSNGQSVIYRSSSDKTMEVRHKTRDANGNYVDSQIVFVGEIKFWLGLEANIPAGWLALKGSTVGNTGSGATYAGTQYQDLYYHLWNNLDNTAAPVSTGRGASAAADWTALKTITMPDGRSKMPIGGGQASGMTLRKEGYTGGGETKDVSHVHGLNNHVHAGPNHQHTVDVTVAGSDLAGPGYSQQYDGTVNTGFAGTGNTGGCSTDSASGGSATQDVMNPWIAIWMIIKY